MKKSEFAEFYCDIRDIGKSDRRTDREIDTERLSALEYFFRTCGKKNFSEEDIQVVDQISPAIGGSRPLHLYEIIDHVAALVDPRNDPA